MKKQITTKGHTDGKSPRAVEIELVEGNLEFSIIEIKCDHNQLEDLLNRNLEGLKVKQFNILSYTIGNNEDAKRLASYHPDHITIRYFLARKFCPHESLDAFEKIERDLTESYEKFKKSLNPYFRKFLDD